MTKRKVIDGTDTQETAYTYVKGVNGSATPLIERIIQLGERTLYTYDEVGNILSVEFPDRRPEEDPAVLSLKTEDGVPLYPSSPGDDITCIGPVYDGAAATDNPVKDDNGKQVFFGDVQDTVGTTALVGHADGRQSNRISFQYDALGQLVRENNPFDSTASVQGTTWVQTYDQGGNILNKVAYPFTEGNVETAVHTDTYTYDNANWRDQLTAYNGTPITYDAIGNPLSDGTWTNIWQHGRQLAQTSKDGETVSFVYNEDGLRVQKTATSTGTTKYILHGKNIVHLTNGNDELHFFYDAQGRVAVVEYNGTAYRYVHNLQGDVVALIDAEGNKVAEYWYDAWGKPLSKTGLMAETLGSIQPFRYRGYVWDEETGLYYLRLRYYSHSFLRFINSDASAIGNIYAYCSNRPIIHHDEDGDEEELVLYEEVYLPPDEPNDFFTNFILPRIMGFMQSPSDYKYNPNGYKRISIRKDGRIKAGSIACAHLMFEITGHGSKTSRYRYSQARRLGIRSGALFNSSGQLNVELREGMEVYKPSYRRDEYGNRIKVDNGHVGMLIMYDFGDGEGKVWAVVQSASTRITKCKSNWDSDPGGGPVITSFYQHNGKSAWVNFTDPRFVK